jgi:mRNA-degrading endonuclease RelE of RelBE toxin-antitoxin system
MTIIMVIMTKRYKFILIYSPITKAHLRTIDSKYYSLIRASIEKNLQFEPDIETTNRKPLKRQVAFEAEWELRFGPDNRFRVFYDIEMTSHEVFILAIGEKDRNCLVIGGKEIKL